MRHAKHDVTPKQESPVQFRPGAELAHLVGTFASQRQISLNEAFKNLAALAIVGLDCRYYDLLTPMATAVGGTSGFTSACLSIYTALLGAARLRGEESLTEADRIQFVLGVVNDFVANKGQTIAAGPFVLASTMKLPSKPSTPESASSTTEPPIPEKPPIRRRISTRFIEQEREDPTKKPAGAEQKMTKRQKDDLARPTQELEPESGETWQPDVEPESEREKIRG